MRLGHPSKLFQIAFRNSWQLDNCLFHQNMFLLSQSCLEKEISVKSEIVWLLLLYDCTVTGWRKRTQIWKKNAKYYGNRLLLCLPLPNKLLCILIETCSRYLYNFYYISLQWLVNINVCWISRHLYCKFGSLFFQTETPERVGHIQNGERTPIPFVSTLK